MICRIFQQVIKAVVVSFGIQQVNDIDEVVLDTCENFDANKSDIFSSKYGCRN